MPNIPIDHEWTDEQKGLHKVFISYKYQPVQKPNELSKCCVTITDIVGLNDHHESAHLRAADRTPTEHWITMMSAVTPIDCYIEQFLKQMVSGETSRCTIQTKSAACIEFTVRLMRCELGGHMHTKSANELLQLAQRYRVNGVAMFSKYPRFAQNYFGWAAKLLISCRPFDTLGERADKLGETNAEQFESLLRTVQSNLAACLIKEQRYEDAVHVLSFAERTDHDVPDKAIYRRANALYRLGRLDDAKDTIERINYKENQECLALYRNIAEKLSRSNESYRNMVKNMFR